MKRSTVIALSILGLLILTILFMQTPLMRVARGATWDYLVRTIGLTFGLRDVRVSDDTFEELATLKAENVRLQAQASDYNRLKIALGTPAYDSFIPVSATILARPIDTFQNEYVITKGVRDGVYVGAPVVVQGSVLVGFIHEVSERTSVFRLVTHPETTITAEAVSEDEGVEPGRGLLKGQRFTSSILSTVPRDAQISEGESVVTSSSAEIPYGLLIGSISKITNNENEPYQSASIAFPYTASNLRAVNVLVVP